MSSVGKYRAYLQSVKSGIVVVTHLTVERVGCDGYPQVSGSEGRTRPTCNIIIGDFKARKEATAEKSIKERTI